MIVRRVFVLLVLVAAIGFGLVTVTAAAGSRVRPSARAAPRSCYIVGQTCSIHPCVEFIANLPAGPVGGRGRTPLMVIPRLATPCRPPPAALLPHLAA